jgi:glycogen debranching enzyme
MRTGQDVPSGSRATSVEWLLANGLGGSCSGSASGAPARSSQALLVAGALGRPTALLLRLDERVSGKAGSFELATRRLRARGQVRLEEFRVAPWPTWRWNVGGTIFEKSLFALSGHDAVVVSYRHLSGPTVHLAASPLCVVRGLDQPPRQGARLLGTIRGIPGRVRIELASWAPALTLWHNGTFLPARVWVRGIEYPGDEAADTSEDALVPGHAEGRLAPGRAFHLVFAAEDALFKTLAAAGRLGAPPSHTLTGCVAKLDLDERARLDRWRHTAIAGADFTARQAAAAHGGPAAEAARRREPLVDDQDRVAVDLALALRAGLVRRGQRRTLAATLPPGEERGADTLQAVQALVSLRGFELARDVLRGYVEYLDEGLAPEAFDAADGRPRYGGPAPALWLVASADLYARRSADSAFLSQTLYPALEGVMQALRQGTRHGVRVDTDGLLAVDGVKRVDLNALWYHALVAMAQLSRLLSRRETGAFYLAWAHEHQKLFGDAFWDDENDRLYEALTPQGAVRGLSPAQALAVSLPPALLPPERAQRLVATLERELLTPFGLREAPASERISTASLGAFVTAYLRVHQRSAAAQARARGWVEAARATGHATGHVPATLRLSAGGSCAEPVGDPASMLAAAELLRVWIEELEHASEPARTAGPA